MNPYMNAQHVVRSWEGPETPIAQLIFPPFKKEVKNGVKELLESHGCTVEVRGADYVVTFPEGTTRREIFPRTFHERHRIKLADGFDKLMNQYDPYRELNLLFLIEDCQS